MMAFIEKLYEQCDFLNKELEATKKDSEEFRESVLQRLTLLEKQVNYLQADETN